MFSCGGIKIRAVSAAARRCTRGQSSDGPPTVSHTLQRRGPRVMVHHSCKSNTPENSAAIEKATASFDQQRPGACQTPGRQARTTAPSRRQAHHRRGLSALSPRVCPALRPNVPRPEIGHAESEGACLGAVAVQFHSARLGAHSEQRAFQSHVTQRATIQGRPFPSVCPPVRLFVLRTSSHANQNKSAPRASLCEQEGSALTIDAAPVRSVARSDAR